MKIVIFHHGVLVEGGGEESHWKKINTSRQWAMILFS